MDWRGATFNPEFSSDGNNTLNINGSLFLSEAMKFSFAGIIQFTGDFPNQIINLSNHTIPNKVKFDAPKGEWRLEGDFKVYREIDFRSGTLITQDHLVETQHFVSNQSNFRKLIFGKSQINILLRDPSSTDVLPSWAVFTANLELEAVEATVHFVDKAEANFTNSGPGKVHFKKVLFESHLVQFFIGANTADRIDSLIFNGSANLYDNLSIGYLKLSPGFTYSFARGEFNIEDIEANGNCQDGLIYLNSFQKGEPVNIFINKDVEFTYLAVSGMIQEGSGQLSAQNSIDLRFNRNWKFSPVTPRRLFWVGDSGNWEDTDNWSLSSGGVGGECIPTALDDVIFDEQSFSGAGSIISSETKIRAHVANMTFINIPPNIGLENFYLTIYKDLNLEPGIAMDVLQTEFRGEGALNLETANNFFRNGFVVNVELGALNLNNTLNLGDYIYFFKGDFISNGHIINANWMHLGQGFSVLDLDKSHITLDYDGPFWGLRSNTDLNTLRIPSTDFTIELTGKETAVQLWYNKNFGRLLFSNPDGFGEVFSQNAHFSQITFLGNGAFDASSNRMDSLIMSAGQSYVLANVNDFTQTINSYWKILGNPCAPISLSAKSSNPNASVVMPEEAILIADYINMEDIVASGGNAFLAGSHSIDLRNSNVGWVFENENTNEDGILGPDRILCKDSELILSPNENTSAAAYLWNNGSTQADLLIDQPGTYSLAISYSDTCTLLEIGRVYNTVMKNP